METSAVNPIAKIMLVVNASQRFQKWFATDSVSAQKYYL